MFRPSHQVLHTKTNKLIQYINSIGLMSKSRSHLHSFLVMAINSTVSIWEAWSSESGELVDGGRLVHCCVLVGFLTGILYWQVAVCSESRRIMSILWSMETYMLVRFTCEIMRNFTG